MERRAVAEFTMRKLISAAMRVFLPAYGSALAWILAGIGWGVVIGSSLDAAAGRGTEGLLDAAEGAALVGSAGALFAAVAGCLTMTCLHGVTLVPLIALVGMFSRASPPGQIAPGIMNETSVRSGALVSVILGLFAGMTFGAMCGAGIALEEVYGKTGPTPALHWGTALGTLAGGVAGLVEMGRTVWRALPEHARQQLRL
jgi:hypothetical protein